MNNKVMFFWALIISGLLGSILLLGYNKQDKVYLNYVKELKESSLKYIEDNKLTISNTQTQLVFVKDLIENDYIKYKDDYMGYCIQSISISKELFKTKYDLNRDCTVIDELEEITKEKEETKEETIEETN